MIRYFYNFIFITVINLDIINVDFYKFWYKRVIIIVQTSNAMHVIFSFLNIRPSFGILSIFRLAII